MKSPALTPLHLLGVACIWGFGLPASADMLFAPPVTLQSGDQATGTFGGFVRTSSTASPGSFGAINLRFAHAPPPGDILRIDLFANNASSTPLSTYTWQLQSGPTTIFDLVAFPFGTMPLGPGASSFLDQWGGTYSLTMISGTCDITAITASIAPVSTTVYSTTSFPVVLPAPEPTCLGPLALLACIGLPSRRRSV